MLTTAGAVALADGASLKPGDNIRTGQNGRVLLTRGQETMLISPNSAISISKGKTESLSTTIIQQTGSILLEVEKRNVKHFQVETPYLAAVVKGTQFRVTVDEAGAQVEVARGQVEVSDFKSGQYALIQPNQVAKVAAQGPVGLSLSGSGTLSPIQHGTPRPSPVSPAPGPKASTAAAPAPGPNTAFAPPDTVPTGQRVRVAQSSQVEAPPAVPTGHASAEDLWNSGVATVSKWFGFSNARRSRGEDITLGAALAGGIGVFVAGAVSAGRRMRKKK
jgi:hypothetical protein